jgi:hypothetical protein
MSKRFAVVATALLACAFALGAQESLRPVAAAPVAQLYQIELIPSGKLVSQDLPVLKGTTYRFHQYPTGTLISVRKSTVKQITRLSPTAVAAANPTATRPIGNLAMQGSKSGSGRPSNMGRAREAVAAANAGTAGRTASPE